MLLHVSMEAVASRVTVQLAILVCCVKMNLWQQVSIYILRCFSHVCTSLYTDYRNIQNSIKLGVMIAHGISRCLFVIDIFKNIVFLFFIRFTLAIIIWNI